MAWHTNTLCSPTTVVDKYSSFETGSTVKVNTLRPRQNGRLFADDSFKRIFLNENIRISTKNSLKFVPKGLINNIPALVLIMAWRRPGDKPLSEPMLVRSLTHICVTRPQWVKMISWTFNKFAIYRLTRQWPIIAHLGLHQPVPNWILPIYNYLQF